MKINRLIRSLMMLWLVVGFAAANSAYAQGKGQAEEMAKAERAAKAREQADELRKEEPHKTPPASIPLDPANVWVLQLSNGGTVRIQLRADVAPGHVERIKALTNSGFYNGLIFHRVIPGFMAQGGDPNGDGTGGSSEPDLTAEFSDLPHVRGVVSMARAQDENSANSQFFIMFMPRMQLDHKYTVVGRVIEGMQYVDAIEKGEPPVNPTKIVSAHMEAAGG
ncbi:MAG: peptidylprolyl isomerase [Sphingobium sp.]|nr:peptidylprolyl isomerase [Sphingobium sp.]MCP5399680.1 peptidylprolyl isomerase [Sphingomonas sp.]